jgi:radical SAM superfamily enzyme YgiQ (UPF0313 family)
MKILLVDVDSKMPNLALMKISSHFKKGHSVSFNEPDPDKIFASCIFTKNAWKAKGLQSMFPGIEVKIGGSGVSLATNLPPEIEEESPDYDLYPSTFSMGFTTRGCIRKCPFCVVHEKEGSFRRNLHVKNIVNPRFKDVVLLDNNILADKPWFLDQTDWLNAMGLRLKICQGLDARLLDQEIAERLKITRQTSEHTWFFAWDSIEDQDKIRKSIEIMQKAGINTRNNVAFYVLVGFNSSFEIDLYRCQKLKEWGTRAFVMKYKSNPELNRLARWANRANIFFLIDFHEYTRKNQR